MGVTVPKRTAAPSRTWQALYQKLREAPGEYREALREHHPLSLRERGRGEGSAAWAIAASIVIAVIAALVWREVQKNPFDARRSIRQREANSEPSPWRIVPNGRLAQIPQSTLLIANTAIAERRHGEAYFKSSTKRRNPSIVEAGTSARHRGGTAFTFNRGNDSRRLAPCRIDLRASKGFF